MKNLVSRYLLVLFSLFSPLPAFLLPQSPSTESGSQLAAKWTLVIHGGAGGPAKGVMPAEKEKAYLDEMSAVLQAGAKLLENGGTSLDAVEMCVKMMEDSPLFNAGKGAVFTAEGKNEMDAGIMDGKMGKAGAVAGVTTIKNPVAAARAVMEKSEHVMLIGEGAEIFARKQGLEIVDPSYFFTKDRWDALQKVLQKEKEKQPGDAEKHGTVGAVALDRYGNLSAATSTGGMTNKMKGRIGDTPIIGAGTYANNRTCAVSATGHGEFFIRHVVSYDISARMEYLNESLSAAANYVINEKLKSQGANGGIIAVDKDGNIAMTFNTNAMFRGSVTANGKSEVAIY